MLVPRGCDAVSIGGCRSVTGVLVSFDEVGRLHGGLWWVGWVEVVHLQNVGERRRKFVQANMHAHVPVGYGQVSGMPSTFVKVHTACQQGAPDR